MENDVVGKFNAEVERRFHSLHASGIPLSYAVGTALSGQDHDLADYLFAVRGRFALIEFKADRHSTLSELKKPARRRLVEACLEDKGTLKRSLNIHHLAWEKLERNCLPSFGEQLVAKIEVARYIPELALAMEKILPSAKARLWNSSEFITSFFEVQSAGTNIRRFRRYLRELYEIAGKSGNSGLSTLEGSILVYIPEFSGPAQIQTIRFTSFDHLMSLTINHKLPPQLEPRRAPEKSRDRGPSL